MPGEGSAIPEFCKRLSACCGNSQTSLSSQRNPQPKHSSGVIASVLRKDTSHQRYLIDAIALQKYMVYAISVRNHAIEDFSTGAWF